MVHKLRVQLGFTKLVLEEIGAPPTTSYLYYLKHTAPYTLNRLDVTIPVTSGSAVSPLTSPTDIATPRSDSMQIRHGDIIVWGYLSTNMQFVDKTAMTITTTLTGSASASYYNVDNLDQDLLFILRHDNPFGLYRIPIPASGAYTNTHSVPASLYIHSNILNFGPYQYIGLVRTDLSPTTFNMYMKAYLSPTHVPMSNTNTPKCSLWIRLP